MCAPVENCYSNLLHDGSRGLLSLILSLIGLDVSDSCQSRHKSQSVKSRLLIKSLILDSDNLHCGAGPGVHVQDVTQRPGDSALSAEEPS